MAGFPPPLESIDWNALTFSVTETYGHIESIYNAEVGEWDPLRWVSDPYLRVHGMSPGLNYGLQCFEGIRAYRTSDNRIAIFRPRKNAARMNMTASFVGIPPLPESLFLRAVHLAVGANATFVPPHTSEATLYIRPVLFGSGPQISLTVPQQFTFCVYVTPIGSYHGPVAQKALILEDLDRAAPRGTGHVKLGGNYAPVFRFSAKAREIGFGITLHLDSASRTEIDEFTTSGFIGVKKHYSSSASPENRKWSNKNDGGMRVTLIVPDSPNVIKSVTSESACEIATSLGWEVQRRRIPYEELEQFDEVIAAGTAAALLPIASISMRSRGDVFTYETESGDRSVAEKLLRTLRSIQKGETEDTFSWLEYVKEELALISNSKNTSLKDGMDTLP